MLKMKHILASQFWNQEVESTRSLEAVARTLPSEPPPLGITQGSRISRAQQLLLLQRFLPVPFTPSYAVDNDDGGGLVLDRVLASAGGMDWWATLTGRLRAQRLWAPGKSRGASRSGSRNESHGTEPGPELGHESGPPSGPGQAAEHSPGSGPGASPPASEFQQFGSRLLNPSLYALSTRARLSLGPKTTISASSELPSLAGVIDSVGRGGERRPPPEHEPEGKTPLRGRLTLRHSMKKHAATVEAALHERCVDREGRYWDVPQSLSLDLLSLGAPGGLRYRLGVHHSSGTPQGCDKTIDVKAVPFGALPGTRAQAALSLERQVSVWKDPTRSKKPYNLLAARPRLTFAGMLGGLLSANLNPRSDVEAPGVPSRRALSHVKPLAADLFASFGATAQLGLFERRFLDHTLVSGRVDLGAASAFAAAVSQSSSLRPSAGAASEDHQKLEERGYPTVALTMQQQIYGPVRARVDTRYALAPFSSPRGVERPRTLECTYGLDCSLEKSGAARLVVWYSPTRREGMVEVRILDQ